MGDDHPHRAAADAADELETPQGGLIGGRLLTEQSLPDPSVNRPRFENSRLDRGIARSVLDSGLVPIVEHGFLHIQNITP